MLILIAANLLALAGLTFLYPHLMLSPGPLVASHAELTTNCFACHAPWRGAESRRCTTCHAPVDIGLRTTTGALIARSGGRTPFHQELVSQDCMACHIEHQGSRLSARNQPQFSHALLRDAIRGRCEGCHHSPDDRLHRQITGNCASCHRTQGWKPATFDHAKLFVLDSDHNTECATCHTGSDFNRYTCYGCHEHQPARVRAEHLEEGIRDFEDCVKCHRSAREEPEGRSSRGGRERD